MHCAEDASAALTVYNWNDYIYIHCFISLACVISWSQNTYIYINIYIYIPE